MAIKLYFNSNPHSNQSVQRLQADLSSWLIETVRSVSRGFESPAESFFRKTRKTLDTLVCVWVKVGRKRINSGDLWLEGGFELKESGINNRRE